MPMYDLSEPSIGGFNNSNTIGDPSYGGAVDPGGWFGGGTLEPSGPDLPTFGQSLRDNPMGWLNGVGGLVLGGLSMNPIAVAKGIMNVGQLLGGLSWGGKGTPAYNIDPNFAGGNGWLQNNMLNVPSGAGGAGNASPWLSPLVGYQQWQDQPMTTPWEGPTNFKLGDIPITPGQSSTKELPSQFDIYNKEEMQQRPGMYMPFYGYGYSGFANAPSPGTFEVK